jgi:hypothetical protein
MDGAHIATASPEVGGASSSASSASSYGGSASGRSWLRKGVHLRRRRRRVVAVKGGERAGGGDVQDLALPLGMSFAAVLAQVSGMCLASFLLFLSRQRRPKDSIFTPFVRSSLPCYVCMVRILCERSQEYVVGYYLFINW